VDNLAHALVGAAIGRAAVGSRVPRAAVLGAVAANAPDWAEVFTGWPWPGAVFLSEHRGITHALAGVAVEIVGLVVVLGTGWWWWRRRAGTAAPVPWGWLALLVGCAVLSHPYMDWQGSYGWRPFLPWDGRWLYGDLVAIVDPLFWIVPLIALSWGGPRHWRPLLGFALIGVPATALVLLHPVPAGWLKGVWIIAVLVGVIGWVAHWYGISGRRRVAAYALTLLAAYAGAQGLVSLRAKAAVRRAAVARFGTDAQWAALTVVGHPFRWQPIYASRDSVATPRWVTARHLEHPAVRRALRDTRDGRAIGVFARFLTAAVDSGMGSPTVILRDARYARGPGGGWATVTVAAPR